MNDKEKLEAIKKVLSDTPARSGSYQVTAQDFEKADAEPKADAPAEKADAEPKDDAPAEKADAE